MSDSIQEYAKQCVKCGLCLPSCPTYVQTQHEAHSPRGRIFLIDMLAKKTISADSTTLNYLNHCLTCRACEAVCPSNVRYGHLIDTSRDTLFEEKLKPSLPGWVALITKYKSIRFCATFILKLCLRLGIKRFFNFFNLKLFNVFSTALYAFSRPNFEYYQQKWPSWQAQNKNKAIEHQYSTKNQRKISLFQGCVEHIIDEKLFEFSKQLLHSLGYEILPSSKQSCCGALHLHQGDYKTTLQMAQKNSNALQQGDLTLFLSSACGLTLKEYGSHPLLAPTLSSPLPESHFVDILDFIADHIEKWGWTSTFSFSPIPQGPYALHIPCTQKNGLKSQGAARFLHLVPGMKEQVLEIQEQKSFCCGGAGIYFWECTEMSGKLGKTCVENLLIPSPKVIFTTNIGCRLQLQSQLNRLELDIPILHPLEFLMKILR